MKTLNIQDLENIEKIQIYNSTKSKLAQIGFSTLCGLPELNVEAAPTQFGNWSEKMSLPDFSSYQSLFFNTSLNLFKDTGKWCEHLLLVDTIAKNNNCPYLVLGSPAARFAPADYDRTSLLGLQDSELFLAAALASLKNTNIIAVEANPSIYNSNVCCTAAATIKVVKYARVKNENIYFHLDSGCLEANGENPLDIFVENLSLIKRIHISEPHLVAYQGKYKNLMRAAISNNVGISLEQKADCEDGWSTFLRQIAELLNEL